MNMQMSPASTHSHQLRDPLVDDHTDLIGYKVVFFGYRVFETVFGSLQF